MSTGTPTTHPEYAEWTRSTTLYVLDQVFQERARQVRRYGLNRDVKAGTGPETRWLGPYTGDSAQAVEQALRADYEDFQSETGLPTWVHLIREEVAEAFAEDDPVRLEAELIQVAALCVSMVERLHAGDL
jgi:hypothetical protein